MADQKNLDTGKKNEFTQPKIFTEQEDDRNTMTTHTSLEDGLDATTKTALIAINEIDLKTSNDHHHQKQQIDLIVSQKKIFQSSLCCPPKRYVLLVMGFFCMVMLYALRVNLSVAIVSMVNPIAIIPPNRTNNVASTNETNSHHDVAQQAQFDWDENTQGLILGSFFWGYVIFQLPGGRMADTFGSKWLLFSGIFMTSVLTIVSPLAAHLHYGLFIGCRILEGVFEGVVIPAMHSMIAKWFPPYERSTAAGVIYSGSMIGTVITMPIAAIICDSDQLGGWPAVFYVFGLAGIVWAMLWWWLIYETPITHANISQQELRLILTSQNHNSSQPKPEIPWRDILTSVPLWALTVAHFGQNWGFYTLLTQMPRYFDSVLDFDLKSNGVYSALPYLSQALVAGSMGFVCDRLFRGGWFSLTVLRKSFNTIAFIGAAACLIAITFIERDRVLNIALLVLALGVDGMSMAGFSVTHVDMSPNFAGTLMGITNCVANFAGILAPMAVGEILSSVVGDNHGNDAREKTLLAWQYIFYLSAAIFIGSAIIFLLFGSNRVQAWNDSPDDAHCLKENSVEKKWQQDERDDDDDD